MYYRSVKMIEVNNYIYIWVKKYFVDLSLHLISFLIKSQFNFGYLKSCVFFQTPLHCAALPALSYSFLVDIYQIFLVHGYCSIA